MSLPVGKDIESICGKCGDVWHVVVAKVGDSIAKVQCKQCGAVHRYRPPQKEKMKQMQRERVAREPKERSARASLPSGPRVPADPLRAIRDYKPRETYTAGDTIMHVTFGRGVVEAATPDGKIEVFFDDQRRVLVHARGAAPSSSSNAPLPARRPPGSDGESEG